MSKEEKMAKDVMGMLGVDEDLKKGMPYTLNQKEDGFTVIIVEELNTGNLVKKH